MRLLYLAWKHAGVDPYRLFNGLGADYRPLERPEGEPLPPPYPGRIRNVIYAFASFAERESMELALARGGA